MQTGRGLPPQGRTLRNHSSGHGHLRRWLADRSRAAPLDFRSGFRQVKVGPMRRNSPISRPFRELVSLGCALNFPRFEPSIYVLNPVQDLPGRNKKIRRPHAGSPVFLPKIFGKACSNGKRLRISVDRLDDFPRSLVGRCFPVPGGIGGQTASLGFWLHKGSPYWAC